MYKLLLRDVLEKEKLMKWGVTYTDDWTSREFVTGNLGREIYRYTVHFKKKMVTEYIRWVISLMIVGARIQLINGVGPNPIYIYYIKRP